MNVVFEDMSGNMVTLHKFPRRRGLTDAQKLKRREQGVQLLKEKNVQVTTRNLKSLGIGIAGKSGVTTKV